MAGESSSNSGPFDVRTIKQLTALMSQHDLSEIDLRQGDLRIRLRRGSRAVAIPPAEAIAPSVAPPPAAAATAPAASSEPDKQSKPLTLIKSPTPGTFYSAATPGTDPFVRVGSRVTPTTVVGIIEAMKIFNEIPAECGGAIVEVCVENQQPVEYGQVLFKVDPTA